MVGGVSLAVSALLEVEVELGHTGGSRWGDGTAIADCAWWSCNGIEAGGAAECVEAALGSYGSESCIGEGDAPSARKLSTSCASLGWLGTGPVHLGEGGSATAHGWMATVC